MGIRTFATLLVLLGFLAGCGGSLPRPESGPGAPAATAAVDRFLELVSQRNYMQMGWVFGTPDGPIIRRDPLPDVERRMFALADLLVNQGYAVGPGTPVPGRVGAAQSFNVVLRQSGRDVTVPFTAVRGPEGRWFVEQVGVEAVTNR